MSEDDTFLALKRTPFRRMFLMCADATKLSGLLAADNVKLLEANGWTYDQFVFKMEDYHDISFSVNDHKNPVWRANFLAGKG